MTRLPRPVKPPTTPRQSPDVSFGGRPESQQVRMGLNPNYALSISCYPEPAMPRHFPPSLWEAGSPGEWYTRDLEPRILASDAGMIFLRNPGGMEEVGDLLLFDQLTQCQNYSGTVSDSVAATRLRIMGEHTEWAWVCSEIRKAGRRVALYLGDIRHWDNESPKEKIRLIEKELTPFYGTIDECYSDCGNESYEHSAYAMFSQICHYNGILAGGENRALKGRYSHMMNHPHCCIGTTLDGSNGLAGDTDHAPITPGMVCWPLSDDADPGLRNASRYMREYGRCAVGIWEGIKASDIQAVGDQ